MKKKIKFILLFLTGLMIIYFIREYKITYAEEKMTHVKVGLESRFKGISELSIKNNNLRFSLNGYSADISSSGGTKVRISNKYYLKSNKSYSNYNEAKHEADYISYNQSNSNTKVGLSSDGFHVYIGEYSSESAAKGDMGSYSDTSPISGNLLELIGENSTFIAENKGDFLISSQNNDFLNISDRKYRGNLGFIVSGSSFTVYNLVTVNEYLYSVVPSEMPASWELEALKSQAVAARTYLMTQAGVHSKSGYDICDGTHCQAYNGATSENERTTKAVNETNGVVAYYNNSPINAVFFSSSGGITDNSENTWPSAVPYLKSVVEINENNSNSWTRKFTQSELNQIGSNNGIGNITNIKITNIKNERVAEMVVTGTGGTKTLTGENVRTFFSSSKDGSLKSRYFRLNEAVPEIKLNSNPNIPPSETPVVSESKEDNIYIMTENSTKISGTDGLYTISSNGINKLGDDLKLMTANGISDSLNFNNSVSGTRALSNSTSYANEYASSSSSNTARYSGGELTVYGRGWGHGVGMSQYGAKGMAELGYTFDQILKYYYTGINLSSMNG